MGAGHQSHAPPAEGEQQNSSNDEGTTRPQSLETRNPGGILVPRPRKPNTAVWSYWMNYMQMSQALVSNLPGMRSSSSESGNESAGALSEGMVGSEGHPPGYIPVLSKDQRAAKVARYLEKRRKQKYCKKIRYEYRQKLADRRIRYQGRFVKTDQARELILKGAPVTVKDKADLNRLFEEDKTNELAKKFEDNIRAHYLRPIFRTVHDTSVRDRMSSSDSNSSNSGESISKTLSPLLEAMNDVNPALDLEKQCANIGLNTAPIFKL
jgi:hypothetical protein